MDNKFCQNCKYFEDKFSVCPYDDDVHSFCYCHKKKWETDRFSSCPFFIDIDHDLFIDTSNINQAKVKWERV